MLDSSFAPNISGYGLPKHLLDPFYDRDVQTHLREELDHRCLRDAPVVTPPLLYSFEYSEQ